MKKRAKSGKKGGTTWHRKARASSLSPWLRTCACDESSWSGSKRVSVEMAKWNEIGDTLCPIARATAIVGDRWTIPIIRELFVGSARFDEIQAQTGSTAQMRPSPLKRFEAQGMSERRAYSRPPLRHD